MKRLIITRMPVKGQLCRVGALEDEGRLIELHLEKPDKEKLLGSIHVGKVQKVVPNIRAAFVEIADRVPCFYSLSGSDQPIYTGWKKSGGLKAGDELLVQVTQEALKMKAPTVSCNLSFPGKYLVLTTGNRRIGVSSKLPSEKKQELQEFLRQALGGERKFGVIARTNAADADKEVLLEELEILTGDMERTLHKGSYSPCFTQIKAAPDLVDRILNSTYWEDVKAVITDEPENYQRIRQYVGEICGASSCEVRFYEDKLLPLYKLYCLETGLSQGLEERVWMKSGGFLVIQQTEAFVAIDVNSGKHTAKKPSREEYRKINLEAAREIARQLRLRNLYGMILIDFINMDKYEDRSELVNIMRNFVREDRVSVTVVDVTALGIMELTRKKADKSLAEQVREITGGDSK